MGFSLRSHDGATVHRRDDGEHDEDRDGMLLGVSSLREGVGSAWIFVRSVPCEGPGASTRQSSVARDHPYNPLRAILVLAFDRNPLE